MTSHCFRSKRERKTRKKNLPVETKINTLQTPEFSNTINNTRLAKSQLRDQNSVLTACKFSEHDRLYVPRATWFTRWVSTRFESDLADAGWREGYSLLRMEPWSRTRTPKSRYHTHPVVEYTTYSNASCIGNLPFLRNFLSVCTSS